MLRAFRDEHRLHSRDGCPRSTIEAASFLAGSSASFLVAFAICHTHKIVLLQYCNDEIATSAGQFFGQFIHKQWPVCKLGLSVPKLEKYLVLISTK
jgi:hypothetical protein